MSEMGPDETQTRPVEACWKFVAVFMPPVIRQKPREQTCTNAHDLDGESLNLHDFSGKVLRS